MSWDNLLLAIGAWLGDHGLPMAAGFIGGLLAVIVTDRWRRRKRDQM